MTKSMFKNNFFLKIINNSLISLPSPININIWWNFGSLLGLCLMIQIITGFFLSMHYTPHIDMAFNSVIHIIQDVNYGWLFRLLHMNGASMFFICIFIHIGRGIYYNSFYMEKVWFTGSTILLMLMGTAFMGYILPWGQMSFWGATVITNLLSAIPYFGEMIVYWIWGGFNIQNCTLNRFYSIHFILPFVIMMMVIIHLVFLHENGSTNPMGFKSDYNKIFFYPYFFWKDLLGFIILILVIMLINFIYPYMLGDPENFLKADPMLTPMHIQPEWYFLFAYAILRSIPNKFGGVMALLMSILILYFLPLMFNFKNKYINSINSYKKFKGFSQLNYQQFNFWMFVMIFYTLTWIGARPVELPYFNLGQFFSIWYFMFFFMFMFNNMIKNLNLNLMFINIIMLMMSSFWMM